MVVHLVYVVISIEHCNYRSFQIYFLFTWILMISTLNIYPSSIMFNDIISHTSLLKTNLKQSYFL